MDEPDTSSMRSFWEERAQENAVWYVDTSLSYDHPDMERFLETGRKVAQIAFVDAPVRPERTELAVEIGSGLGRICAGLADHFDRVVGIDIAPEMVRRARELVDREGVTFEVGSGAGLAPIGDGTADLVVSFTVFQHIPNVAVIEAYIAEAARVLRPGGVFAFQWNNLPGARRWRIKRSLAALARRAGISRTRRNTDAPEFLGSRVPLPRIERALRSSGLELRTTSELGTLFAWAWAVRPDRP